MESAQRNQQVREMIAASISGLGGSVRQEHVDTLVGTMLELAQKQAVVSGLDEVSITGVTVTPGKSHLAPVSSGAAHLGSIGGTWDGGWSGKACVWYCPDGGPYEEDYCYLVCIEWDFPLKARG